MNTITAGQAMEALRDAMDKDPAYAWSWHCNIAMAAYDSFAGVENAHRKANEAAARFMNMAFSVDTSTFPEYLSFGWGT